MTFDYHTHTTFSHGKGSIEDNVKAAIACGLTEIAISDHGCGHLLYGVKREDLPVMRREIDLLKEKYPQIKIWLSIEANIISAPPYWDVLPEEEQYFDFMLAGYHFGVRRGYCVNNFIHSYFPIRESKSLKKKNTEMTVAAIYQHPIKILTHPGDKGSVNILEIAKACGERGTWMELNAHHGHLSVEEIKIAAQVPEVRFVLSSDAHRPERVGQCPLGLERAKEAGIDLERIVNIRWTREDQK